jgi:rod shape-determining protein MreC
VSKPVSGVIAAPGRWTGLGVDFVSSYFFTVSENRRLKAELKEMRGYGATWPWPRSTRTSATGRCWACAPIRRSRWSPPASSPTAVARSPTPAWPTPARKRASVVGNPVMNERGLVGRVVGVANGASRVLLLTDIASRTPVMIDRTNARAILTGDGGPNPKLEYLRGVDPIKEGDRVVTSGDGGVVPRGLPVGAAVKGLDGRWRVVLFADDTAIDYVRILLFKDFAQLADQKAAADPQPAAGDHRGSQNVSILGPAATAPKPAAATTTTRAAGRATPPKPPRRDARRQARRAQAAAPKARTRRNPRRRRRSQPAGGAI